MKSVFTRTAPLAFTALLLSACAGMPKAVSGPYAVGKSYSVNLDRQWADVTPILVSKPKGVRLLSIDGPLLNQLWITEGLADGAHLVKPLAKEAPTPMFRADMSESELIEFMSDSLIALDLQRLEMRRATPAKFGAADGLRLEWTGKTKEGLDMSALALVAEHNSKLHIILFVAPSEHYFGAQRANVEQIMASATLGR